MAAQAGHLWTKHKDKEGTRRLVDKEMHGALDSNGKGEVAYDSESDTEVTVLQAPWALPRPCLCTLSPPHPANSPRGAFISKGRLVGRGGRDGLFTAASQTIWYSPDCLARVEIVAASNGGKGGRDHPFYAFLACTKSQE